ncbi:AAA domain-containing protein [Multifurca ochricompacta]|uniref:AAA domain-containing protein n=1 Tax=Multifurca ochricompacta TaxID=376703 RepID=A0AAD4M250_9AGAM|nr:AAA domain-containing protein [Multifurca ochricompacta]
MASARRLKRIQNALAPTITSIGTLTLGNISYPVPASVTPSRLPHFTPLDPNDPRTREHLYFLLQKFILGQDVFLVAQPGPYARRLALTFCSMMNAEYEYIALHRDVGETELKQGREIREGGNLVYVDSASVRAVKTGRILIIEGIEKAERGIMPVLNNLLENREINLDDGTHILHPHRHILLPPADAADARFVPAHPSFRVIAIGAPVPPYTGYPLDPPFRSRFQARFLDPTSALLAYPDSPDALPEASAPLWKILRDLVLATQYASEARHVLDGVARSALPPFPQTALAKLHTLLTTFPPPSPIASGSRPLSPRAMGRLMIVLHPELLHAPFQAWALLSERLEEAGLGPLAAPLATEDLDDPGTAVEDATGLLGYTVRSIERTGKHSVRVVFTTLGDGKEVVLEVPAGEGSLRPFPLEETPDFVPSARFVGLLTNCLQAHALGWDISLVPPAQPATASASTSLLVYVLGDVLGYVREAVHVYKELGGRELLMRRVVGEGGATSWEPSPLVQGAWAGRLVHFSGLDVLGPTAGAIARLLQDREIELWEGKRIVASLEEDETNPDLSTAHPSFRVISTASRAAPLRDWLSSEHANMFLPVPAQPMGRTEEAALLIRTGCPPANVDTLLTFAGAYRTRMAPADGALRVRRLGTRALLRIARRLAQFPWDQDVRSMLERALLTDFLPTTEKVGVEELLEEVGIHKITPAFHPPPVVVEDEADRVLLFPAPTDPLRKTKDTRIPRFETASDPEGVASFVPHMDHFYNNSIQSAQMRDLAIDFELLQDHLVLLGNQGVGKNKIVDRLCQLLQRPREYIQLHRDSTVQQLMFHTTLERGVIRYTDSPLLRAVAQGRVLVVDEVDKAPEHVVAIFRSLAGQGELTLSDGRRLTHVVKRDGDLPIHPNFRLILLANRPGYPFLGNHFMQVLGDNFSCHAISNPDLESERRLLTQLAPELDENLITRLIGAFHDLRQGYESGSLAYPYSLRELIAIVRHMRAYPDDDLDDTLRNVFDFDVYRIETTEKLDEILRKHGLRAEDVNFTEQTKGKRKQLDMQFDPEKTDLDKPKHGQEDPNGGAHSGGNAFAGGTGGRDTAGMGGRGGFKRLYKKGHDIYQVSKKLKDDVPESVRAQARLMARKELEARLAALNITSAGANSYGALLSPVQAHIAQLQDLLEHLAAREEERVWVKRQTDGELDDTRLTEGLTGEAAVYKRRGMAKPELGRPQVKPKRIRFVFDISASMYRFQYDGRLQRSLETAVMLMESFNLLTRKDKYKWDMYGHSGDEPEIPLVNIGDPIEEVSQRWAVTQKMKYTTQYTWSGDTTVAAIEKAVNEVAAFDGDDHFVIALTDANFGQYNITAEDLGRAMNRHPKVKTALICICEDSEASWVKKHFPGRAFLVTNSADIPKVLRGFLTTMVDK